MIGAKLYRNLMDDLYMAWVIMRREMDDMLRDWRMVVPILFLTLFFPLLMHWAARIALDFVEQYGTPILMEQMVPFLLMVVGFFPISFSLVIALETFVGEKERNSLEPLLSMPISDRQLYLGKMLASTVPPVLASYLGIGVYLLGFRLTSGYMVPASVLLQVVLLTTMEALVMVSGAVVISSHTTSVRAANLLASFIIVPMAVLVQVESAVMFWARYEALWWVALGLLIVDVLLIRVGLQLFNREEILAREMDRVSLSSIWRTFKRQFLQPAYAGGKPFSLRRVYCYDLPALMRQHSLAIICVCIALLLGIGVGVHLAYLYRLPPQIFDFSQLSAQIFEEMPSFSFLPPLTTWGIFWNNVRALLLAACASPISLGSLTTLLLVVPMVIVGYMSAAAAMAGLNLGQFLVAFILPHGIVELPASIVATAFALRMGAVLVTKPAGTSVGAKFLESFADFTKVFIFLVVPLLLVAAFIEANVTLQLALRLYGP